LLDFQQVAKFKSGMTEQEEELIEEYWDARDYVEIKTFWRL
jgi:hypothetical protein